MRGCLRTAGRFGAVRSAVLFVATALPFTAGFTHFSARASLAQEAKLALTTTAFEPGGMIPKQFTCSGADVSPALSWNAPPAGTQSFALIVDDPDAPMGTFVHWVAYNIPAAVRQLPQGVKKGETLANRGKQGQNDFPKTGYGGPCPPPGKPHRYFFRLYALDTTLNLTPPVRRADVDQAMQGHVLAKAELMGKFAR